ncbi:zf-HC2 domain-containing protein [Streptomyces sp. NPDC006339]|uniref:anti-sigma factor family protein n=1 Tax=Streptomyces sp. NPDC006339 TaxID=3156755 RepID=UPI00339FDA59
MTSTADTTQHPDVSEISDLTEGLLSPSRSAAVRQHLDGCPLCADVRASLEEIRGLLGTLPGPPRMPAEIAGRIDAALAAEALLNATAPAPAADTHVSRETSRVRPPVPAPAATAGRPAGRPAASTGPGRPRRSRRRVAAVGAAFGAAALGLSLFFVQSGALNLGGGDPAADRRSDVTAAGSARFDGAPVASTVQALLRQNGTFQAPEDRGAPHESLSAEDGGAGDQRTLAATLPECVKAGTGRTDTVLAFRQGDYQGTAAYLVVLPDTRDGSRVLAYVLDASCASGGGNGTAEVLTQESVPRS